MHLTRSCIGFLIQGSISLLVSGREGEKRAAGDGGRAAQGTGRGFATGRVPRSFYPPPTPSPAETSIPKLLLFCSRERLGSRQEGGGSQVRGDSGDSSGSPPKAAASSRHCTPGLGGGTSCPS